MIGCCFSLRAQLSFDWDEFLKDSLPQYQFIWNDIDKYQLEIIYTKVSNPNSDKPRFKTYHYGLENTYFYPASTVKLPIALLALEKMKEKNINWDNQLFFQKEERNYKNKTPLYYRCEMDEDTLEIKKYLKNIFGLPLHEIKIVGKDTVNQGMGYILQIGKELPESFLDCIANMLIYSDNIASNKMFEFIGQNTIYEKFYQKKWKNWNSAIFRRFGTISEHENKRNLGFEIKNKHGQIIYQQAEAIENTQIKKIFEQAEIGKGYYDSNDSLLMQPMDFSNANYLSLNDLQKVLQSIMFPKTVKKKQRINCRENDLYLLQALLANSPKDQRYFRNKSYESAPDNLRNYLCIGGEKPQSSIKNVKIYNIVGQAYGSLIDVAYITDTENNIGFFVSARLYLNEDGILNDDKYEYQNIGLPFMRDLGKALLKHALTNDGE